ncbi:MAG: hypothetical protein H7222_15735 [Methylotenera sp.]|nr:hypothetical protein [Oligoflexia bacterium]
MIRAAILILSTSLIACAPPSGLSASFPKGTGSKKDASIEKSQAIARDAMNLRTFECSGYLFSADLTHHVLMDSRSGEFSFSADVGHQEKFLTKDDNHSVYLTRTPERQLELSIRGNSPDASSARIKVDLASQQIQLTLNEKDGLADLECHETFRSGADVPRTQAMRPEETWSCRSTIQLPGPQGTCSPMTLDQETFVRVGSTPKEPTVISENDDTEVRLGAKDGELEISVRDKHSKVTEAAGTAKLNSKKVLLEVERPGFFAQTTCVREN